MALTCTQAERDVLAAAIKSGALRVSYADRTVQYQSASEMRQILAEMDEYLSGTTATTRHSRVKFSRD